MATSSIKETLKARGHLRVFLNGKLVRDIPNLVVTVGKSHIASRMADTGIPAQMSHMAIGSGAVAAAAGNTALGAELARVALGTAGGSVAGATVSYTADFPAGTGSGNVTEAGLFNNVSAGVMQCRSVFGVVTKTGTDALTINWDVTIT